MTAVQHFRLAMHLYSSFSERCFYLSRRDMKELMLEFGKRVGAFLVVALVLSAYFIVSL